MVYSSPSTFTSVPAVLGWPMTRVALLQVHLRLPCRPLSPPGPTAITSGNLGLLLGRWRPARCRFWWSLRLRLGLNQHSVKKGFHGHNHNTWAFGIFEKTGPILSPPLSLDVLTLRGEECKTAGRPAKKEMLSLPAAGARGAFGVAREFRTLFYSRVLRLL